MHKLDEINVNLFPRKVNLGSKFASKFNIMPVMTKTTMGSIHYFIINLKVFDTFDSKNKASVDRITFRVAIALC